MSTDSDRIAVPTNGKGPQPLPDIATTPEATGSAPDDEGSAGPITPTQLAIGLGVVASLVLLLLGRARRQRPDD
jgi:hypothetical protein